MKKVIVIVGPTGVGKTKLSVELAKLVNGEIISGDSVQVYREMNIGSAKVSEDEKEGIPHYLLDIKNIEEDIIDRFGKMPKEVYNLLRIAKIKEIAKEHKKYSGTLITL